MEDFQLKLLQKNSYKSLTSEERNALGEWCSNEEEFQGLKHLFIGVEASKRSFQENLQTKKQLDDLFDNKFKTNNRFDWQSFLFPTGVLFFRMPAFQMASGIVIIAVLTFLFVPNNQVQLAKNETNKSKSVKENQTKAEETNESKEVDLNTSKLNPEIKNNNVSNMTVISDQTLVPDTQVATTEQFEKVAVFEANDEISENISSIPASATTVRGAIYASGYLYQDVSTTDEDDNFKKSEMKPVSSKPGVLDYLFTTY
jgi:hypothetical protein